MLVVAASGAAARADTLVVALDPSASEITFELGATLHTVRGRMELRSGRIAFPERGGPASGRIVADARSADTGLDARDEQMHERVLRSAEHPEIAFAVEFVEVVRRGEDSAEVELRGAFELLGSSHPFEIPVRVERVEGQRVRATAEATLPYVAWGLEDVSNFLLSVDDEVTVAVRVEGTLSREEESAP